MSKIIIRYMVTLASEDGETSFCRELQTESIAAVLPCKSKLVLKLTGQWDGFLLFIYVLSPSQYLFPKSSFADQAKFQLMRLFLAPTARRS